MGSDESQFNVSLIVRDKVTRQCPQTTTYLKRKESRSGIEPRLLLLTSVTPYRWAKPAHEVVVDRFYTALFSGLQQTHCALVVCDCERATMAFSSENIFVILISVRSV